MVGYLSRLSYTPVSDDRLDGMEWMDVGWRLTNVWFPGSRNMYVHRQYEKSKEKKANVHIRCSLVNFCWYGLLLLLLLPLLLDVKRYVSNIPKVGRSFAFLQWCLCFLGCNGLREKSIRRSACIVSDSEFGDKVSFSFDRELMGYCK
jgi:hypothetical protein